MADTKTKVAIFEGSFNPPHLGHFAVIEAILKENLATEVWLMPSPSTLAKPIPTPTKYRLEMLRLFVDEMFSGVKTVTISDFEIKAQTTGSSYQTKVKLEQQHANCEFVFVYGSDVLPTISRLVDGTKFLTTSKIIVIDRTGKLPKSVPGNLTYLTDYKKVSIIGSQLRSFIHQGQDVSDNVPASVLAYIKQVGLYAN